MPGFQLLSLVPHSVSFERAGVRVFQQASRGSNMMLSVKQAFPHAFRFAIQTGRPTASVIASDTNTASDGELNSKASPDKGAAAGKLTGAETLKLAKKLIGSRVLVGWPHTYLAMVESISNEMTTYTYDLYNYSTYIIQIGLFLEIIFREQRIYRYQLSNTFFLEAPKWTSRAFVM